MERNAEKTGKDFMKLGGEINKDIVQPALKLTADFVDCLGTFLGMGAKAIAKDLGSEFTSCLTNIDRWLTHA